MTMTTRNLPVLRCRCCGQPLASYEQPPLYSGGSWQTYGTCLAAGCALCGYTLNMDTYPTLDLTPYLELPVVEEAG